MVTTNRPNFAVRPQMTLGQENKIYELYLKQWIRKGVTREFEEKNVYIYIYNVYIKASKHVGAI
jgi:hypothetical protein